MALGRPLVAAIFVVAAGLGAWMLLPSGEDDQADTQPEPEGTALAAVSVPDALSDKARIGQRAFEAKCIACHGANAAGQKGVAPPLVHKIYEPSHHADMAFLLAVQNGVRSHHWPFGNMPPVEGLTRGDVINIVAYIRELQRANGIN